MTTKRRLRSTRGAAEILPDVLNTTVGEGRQLGRMYFFNDDFDQSKRDDPFEEAVK